MNTDTIEKTQFHLIKEKLIQYAISSSAKEYIRKMQPSIHLEVVRKRLKETAEAKNLLNSNQHVPFMGLVTIDYLTKQVEKGILLEPKELIDYADFLRSNRLIQQFMKKNEFLVPLLSKYGESLQIFPEIEDEIYRVIGNGQVKTEASKSLKKIRNSINDCEKEIEDKLNKFLRSSQNKEKIQESFIVKKKERYTVPIKASYKNQISGTIVEISATGATAYIEPAALTKINDKLYQLKMEEMTEVYQILAMLNGLIAEKMVAIQSNMEVISQFDVIFAKGKYSREINGMEPLINKQGIIDLKGVKHPLLGEQAVPLTLSLGKDYRGLTITGPNAGGKTVVLKTVALVTLQTMLGLQIIAEKGTNIAIFDQIFVDIGDQQSIENALSTFSGHMQNIAQILAETKKNSLILLDEIGSGTEPNEGAALAIAIMEAFYQKGSILITTTHYGEIKKFSQEHEDFTTAAMAFDSATLTPKYQLILGQTGESNAFWIADKMKLNQNVLEKARDYLATKEYSTEKVVFSQPKKQEETVLKWVDFEKGDQVLWTEKQKIALVYETIIGSDQVIIYVEKEFVEVSRKRLQMKMKATELYPANYDLGSLFESHKVRKERRDIDRGSKKAHKKLYKEMIERQRLEKKSK